MNDKFGLVKSAQGIECETYGARLMTMNDVKAFSFNPATETALIAKNSAEKRLHAKGLPANSGLVKRLKIAFADAGSSVSPIENTGHTVTTLFHSLGHNQHLKSAACIHASVCGQMQDFKRRFEEGFRKLHDNRL